MQNAFPPDHVRGVLAAASASFDMSLFEFLLALTHGGAAVLVGTSRLRPAVWSAGADVPAGHDQWLLYRRPGDHGPGQPNELGV